MLEVSAIDADRLSPLVDLGPPGCLRADFARRWPALADARWFPALGDGACANVGSGAIGPSRIALTVGTSAAVRMILPRPPDQPWVVPDGLWAYRLPTALSSVARSPTAATSCAGSGIRPAPTGMTKPPRRPPRLRRIPPVSPSCPFWPENDRRAGMTTPRESSPDSPSTRPEQLIRAGMEAVAYRLAAVYDALRPLAAPEHEIVASGGAILVMPSWLQITADALGHSLIASTRGRVDRPWRRAHGGDRGRNTPQLDEASDMAAARPGMLPTWRTTSATVSAGTARRGSSKR